jgi:hypothetical protein
MGLTREVLQKGKAQHSWPPCTYYLISAALDNASIIYYFTKQATLMRRWSVLSLPLQLAFPEVRHQWSTYYMSMFLAGKASLLVIVTKRFIGYSRRVFSCRTFIEITWALSYKTFYFYKHKRFYRTGPKLSLWRFCSRRHDENIQWTTWWQ